MYINYHLATCQHQGRWTITNHLFFFKVVLIDKARFNFSLFKRICSGPFKGIVPFYDFMIISLSFKIVTIYLKKDLHRLCVVFLSINNFSLMHNKTLCHCVTLNKKVNYVAMLMTSSRYIFTPKSFVVL